MIRRRAELRMRSARIRIMATLRYFTKHPPDSVSMVTADYLTALAEHRGRQTLFTRQSPARLKTLREHALIESAVSSNRIEGVEIDRDRAAPLILHRARTRNRPEEEVRGYRDALDLIHAQGARLPVREETILRLHAMVRGDIGDAGRYKERTDPIIETQPDGRSRVRFTPVAAGDTPAAMRELIQQWDFCMAERPAPVPVVLAAFNLDFLCIHPFRDGNGRVSRLLLLLMCYHAGFEFGRYVSIEKLIERNKERYYETLEISSRGWHRGENNAWPYINFILYTLKTACRDFEERFESADLPRGEKSRVVRSAVTESGREFRISDIEGACPGVSRDLVRRVLRELRAEGRIECSGRGRSAIWRKVGGPKRGNKP